MTLDSFVKELKIESKNQPQVQQVEKTKKDTASSLFDNMFGFGEDEEEPMSLFGAKKKKGDKKDPAEKSTIEEEFEEVT
jgi:hypothetical protein